MSSLNTSTIEKNNFMKNPLNATFPFSEEKVLIPDLISIQRTSFENFLVFGLPKVFKKKKKLVFKKNNHTLEIIFFPEWIQCKKPEINSKKAIYLGKTYGCSLYIPVLVKFSGWKKNRLEWLCLGFLPLLTKHGHFVINGIPRVVLHQMIRNPGVYLLENDSRTQLPTARIVPEQGSWINITMDSKARLWFSSRILRRKISALVFLQAVGLQLSEISQIIGHADVLNVSLVKNLTENENTRHDNILKRAHLYSHPKTPQEAQKYIYAHFLEYSSQVREQAVTEKTAKEFFSKTIWNQRNQKIGIFGRKQFSKKLDSPESLCQTHLTGLDLALATKAVLNIVFYKQKADDIDNLTNKRIRGCGEFLYDELNRSLQEIEVVLTRKFSTLSPSEYSTFWRFNRSFLSKNVSKNWKSFFTSGTLSQFMDETNPLAEVTHKRRLTVLGIGGVSSKQTTIQIRGIHPTFYGRMCPIETPEGKNAGLVSSFTVYTQPTSNGSLGTPFFEVYKGQVQKELKVGFLDPQTESSFTLAPSDLFVSNWNQLPKTQLPVRKTGNFEYASWNQISKQSIGILQMISVATSLIPFLEHDDANRALMGSNMQRQAVPVLSPESAIVSTALETRVICDVNHGIRSSKTGYVTGVSSTQLNLYKVKKINFLEKKPLTILVKNPFLKFQKEKIQKFSRLHIYNPVHQKHQKNHFFFSNLTFFSKSIKSPLFLPYHNLVQGYRFFSNRSNQSKKYLNNDIFIQIEKQKNKLNKEKLYTFDTYQRTNQSTPLTQRPLQKEGEWVQVSDLLTDGASSSQGKLAIGKNVLLAYIPWEGYNFEDAILISENLVQKELFTSLHIDYYEVEVKNTQYGIETITKKIPLEIDTSSKEQIRIGRLDTNGLIQVGTWVEEGDYLVGKITPLSPKGPSVQKQYEKLYNIIMQRETTNFKNTSLRVPKGVEGFVIDVQILPPKDTEVLPYAPKDAILRVRIALLQKRTIQVGDKMAGRHGNKGVISKILPAQDMPYLPDGTPIDIVLNPLGVPSRMNVGQIFESLVGLAGKYLNESYKIQLFDEKFGAEASRSFVYSKLYEAALKTSNQWLFEPHHPGKMKVFDGRTGEPFDQPVTVGYSYMLKLIHLVDDKIHARATGPYSAVTQQPVKGRARNGGQRLGEMEVWALQAYGAAFTLNELLTIKSDDIDGRRETVFRIYKNQPLKFGRPESIKVLLRELQSLCFNFQLYSFDSKTKTLRSENLNSLENF